MRIVCPNCETSYQLAEGALGSTGRKVRCARCGTVWHAVPEEDPAPPPAGRAEPVVPEPSEAEWKEALVGADVPAESPVKPAPAASAAPGAVEPAELPSENVEGAPSTEVTLPVAAEMAEADTADADGGAERTIEATPPGFEPKDRREARGRGAKQRGSSVIRALDRRLSTPVSLLAMLVFLALLVSAGIFGRTAIVRAFPDFASLYRLVGLEVNLRGMDFVDVASHREMDGSTPVLIVEGGIHNLESTAQKLAPVRITLKSLTGRDVYAWNYVLPQGSIESEGSVRFKTRLLAPPEAATMAEVRFTDPRTP